MSHRTKIYIFGQSVGGTDVDGGEVHGSVAICEKNGN